MHPAVHNSGVRELQSGSPAADLLDKNQTREIRRSLISVRLAQDHLGFKGKPREFAREVYESLQQDYPDVEESAFCDRLVRLLQLEAISVASRAASLQQEQEHTFCNARILTDIRPVFGERTDQSPVGAVVLHTLKISYHHSRELKDFYVALDSDDVRTLQEVLSRAEEKAETLDSVLDSAKIANLSKEVEVPNGDDI